MCVGSYQEGSYSRNYQRENIYHADADDRHAWLEVLGQLCQRFNGTLHGYWLMSHHYHLLAQTPEGCRATSRSTRWRLPERLPGGRKIVLTNGRIVLTNGRIVLTRFAW